MNPIIPVCQRQIGRGTPSECNADGVVGRPLGTLFADETSKADVFLPAFEGGGTTFSFDAVCKNLQACKAIKVKILLNGWWVVLDVRAERRWIVRFNCNRLTDNNNFITVSPCGEKTLRFSRQELSTARLTKSKQFLYSTLLKNINNIKEKGGPPLFEER